MANKDLKKGTPAPATPPKPTPVKPPQTPKPPKTPTNPPRPPIMNAPSVKGGARMSMTVSQGLSKADDGPTKKSAYGTDPQVARENLSRYQKTADRILAGVKASKVKAGQKKKVESKVNRMLKYFQDGVSYADIVHKIKNDPNAPAPYLSDSNSKLIKDGIISFNIPAGHSCPGKGDCFGICYAMQGPQSWPDAMKKRVQNWGSAERPDFVQKMNEELARWPRKSKHSKTGQIGNIVRIHDSGDFYSQDYIDKWHDIAKSNPGKHFYAYTKALDLDWKKLHNLPNFTVIQSVGGKNDHKIDPTLPHSYIFPTPEAMHSAGYTDTHESDLPAAMAKKNPKIGLVIHGIFSKQHDVGGYGKEFKGGDVAQSTDTSKKPVTKSLAKSTLHLTGEQIPDAYQFDQLDHVSQLAHSSHPADKIMIMALHANGATRSGGRTGGINELEKNAVAGYGMDVSGGANMTTPQMSLQQPPMSALGKSQQFERRLGKSHNEWEIVLSKSEKKWPVPGLVPPSGEKSSEGQHVLHKGVDAKEEHYKLSEKLGRDPTEEELQDHIADLYDGPTTEDVKHMTPLHKLRAALHKTYASNAQRRFFHSEGAKKAGITKAQVKEWDASSKGAKLPEKVQKSLVPPGPDGPNPPAPTGQKALDMIRSALDRRGEKQIPAGQMTPDEQQAVVNKLGGSAKPPLEKSQYAKTEPVEVREGKKTAKRKSEEQKARINQQLKQEVTDYVKNRNGAKYEGLSSDSARKTRRDVKDQPAGAVTNPPKE